MTHIIFRAVENRNYKLVFRGSGNVFCNYVYAFIHDNPGELPFFMLNRSEIYDYYEGFSERIYFDEKASKIIFHTEDEIYEFERDEDFIREYGEDAELIFLEGELWELIYSGYFDPNPLTQVADGWGRRILAVDERVPRI